MWLVAVLLLPELPARFSFETVHLAVSSKDVNPTIVNRRRGPRTVASLPVREDRIMTKPPRGPGTAPLISMMLRSASTETTSRLEVVCRAQP